MLFKKNYLLVLVLVAALMLSSCSEMSAEELKAKIIESNAALDSYAMDVDMQMEIVAVSKSEGTQEMSSDLSAQGMIDRSEKKLYMKSVMSTEISGMSMDFDTETYFIDNIAYIKTMGMWVKQPMELDLWDQQDQISQTTELLESGVVEILPEEDGYYVVKVTPDLEKLKELLADQQQGAFTEDIIDYSDVVKSYSSTVWIDKKTFVIMKSTADIELVMTPENSDIEDDGDFVEMRISSKTALEMTDIGKDFDFTLPAEANDAIDMSVLLGSIGQDAEI